MVTLKLLGRIESYVDREGSLSHNLEDEKLLMTKNQYSKSQTSFPNNLARNIATTATELRPKVRQEDTTSSMDQTNAFDLNISYKDMQNKT